MNENKWITDRPPTVKDEVHGRVEVLLGELKENRTYKLTSDIVALDYLNGNVVPWRKINE